MTRSSITVTADGDEVTPQPSPTFPLNTEHEDDVDSVDINDDGDDDDDDNESNEEDYQSCDEEDLEVIDDSPRRPLSTICCCQRSDCTGDVSNSEHFCSATGRRVFAWCASEEGYGLKCPCVRCITILKK